MQRHTQFLYSWWENKKPVISSYRDTESLEHKKTFYTTAAFIAKKIPRQPRGQKEKLKSLKEGTAGPLQSEAFPSNQSSQQTVSVPKSIPTNNSATQALEESAIC